MLRSQSIFPCQYLGPAPGPSRETELSPPVEWEGGDSPQSDSPPRGPAGSKRTRRPCWTSVCSSQPPGWQVSLSAISNIEDNSVFSQCDQQTSYVPLLSTYWPLFHPRNVYIPPVLTSHVKGLLWDHISTSIVTVSSHIFHFSLEIHSNSVAVSESQWQHISIFRSELTPSHHHAIQNRRD